MKKKVKITQKFCYRQRDELWTVVKMSCVDTADGWFRGKDICKDLGHEIDITIERAEGRKVCCHCGKELK